MEFLKSWLQPGIVLAVGVQAFASHGWIKDIDTRSINNKEDTSKIELKIAALEISSSAATARSAVVETQMGFVVDALKRIEGKMEERSDRKK